MNYGITQHKTLHVPAFQIKLPFVRTQDEFQPERYFLSKKKSIISNYHSIPELMREKIISQNHFLFLCINLITHHPKSAQT